MVTYTTGVFPGKGGNKDAACKQLISLLILMKPMESDVFNTNLHSFLNLLYDLILERWFTENVVRSNAGLTAVQVLPPGYATE